MAFMCGDTMLRREQCFLFQKQIKHFFGYFDPESVFLDNESIFFRGEEALVGKWCLQHMVTTLLMCANPYGFA